MANRTFKQFSIAAGGTPQPLIGTTLGAATVVSSTPVNVLVGDSSMFKSGDWAWFGTIAGSDEERQLVISVPDGTHIKVQKLDVAHLNGAVVRLGNLANSFYVQCKKGNAGSIFVGTQGMNKTGLVKVIAELLPFAAGVQPIDLGDTRSFGGNATSVGDLWVDGTTGDGYSPSVGIV